MLKRSLLVSACTGVVMFVGGACALPVNDDVIIGLPTSTEKSLPYYAVRIPMSLYPRSANSQLSDLKIRNAKGDFLNYAWLDSATEILKIESHTLPFFPVLARSKDVGKDKEVIVPDILRQSDGSLIGQSKFTPTGNATTSVRSWIIDATKLNPAARLVQARVYIDKDFQGIVPLRIDASEDFKNWIHVGGVEQLVQLRHQGQEIQKLSLNLEHCKAKYLRLSLQTSAQQSLTFPQILAIDIDTQEQELVPPKMQWTAPFQAYQCNANSCEYHVPKNTPIDSLRLHLQEQNTLAKVQIFGELPASTSQSLEHRHFRNPLYVLRHQKQMATSPTTQELFLGDVNAYRLELPAGEISTEELSLGGYSLNKIRLQIPAGVKSLGTLAPTISLGSLSRNLAFLARGDAPYRIEFSANAKEGTALDLNTLMPKVNLPDTALAFAEVSMPTAAAEPSAVSSPIKTPAPDKSEGAQKRYWLWAALIAALAVLGAMVWSLLRNIDKENK
ncbi:DUF3999 family protein [Undibacterium sp. Di24W]|uniref:DUF3999 family protein n=1 Tax=Undibacterium sp. Di24W TaxID=3413033 RepID=UPI003BEFC1A9